MRITRLITAALAAGFLLTTTACGADSADNAASESRGDSGGAPAVAPAQPNEQAAPAQGTQDQAQVAPAEGKNEPAQAPDLSVDQRSIIYTGSITLRVENVNEAAARTVGIAAGSGGFVGGDNRNSDNGGANATLTLRVPAGKFSGVVDQLAKLGKDGKEESREINTQDVTEETVDLDARIKVQQARVDSGRRLLGQAKSLNDLVMLEREVATRESDLASLEAKKRRLADLTALSTITVVLLSPAAQVGPPGDEPPGFLAGLRGGWNALLASLGVLVTVLGALLPWLIVVGVPVWLLIWALRRRRRTVVAPATASPQPAVAAAAGDD
ncbi:DUF4349 domain-containing protein [Actinoplanes sp. NPDC051470]|uniref:DUF4349 domain-containing protein n=1 Tax=Actinoplanes sp. NPDC051470 TaxID=3157224 RepID=UPI00341BDF35